MAEILSLEGREVFSWARASVTDGLAKLAERKNVPLDPASREALADEVLGLMDFASIHKAAHQDEQALLTLLETANAGLDGLVLARVWQLIAGFEGKNDPLDPAVRTTAQTIIDRFAATLPDKGAVHWPDPMQLVGEYYATVPRGPVVQTLDDGSVATAYLLGWKLHRDPQEGPALHWVHGDKQGFEYRLNGESHRPHEQGPARMLTPYMDSALSGDEYLEHGKWHRPAGLGPAVRAWDQAGERVAELYYEKGELHRDPKAGPALWFAHDARTDPKASRACTDTKYYVRGKLHRDEEDGPAVIVRDNGTGVIVEEQYWRDGKRHRLGGSARIRRDAAGNVLLEACYRNGALHRDHREGPAYIDEDFDGLGIHCEEYHENGKWHRPSEIGPAIVNRDRAGRVVREFYMEHGKLHRDPKQGPARFEIHDAATVKGAQEATTAITYAVHGETHRPEEEGPAYVMWDNRTGVVLIERYWRDGVVHRCGGPAEVERNADGRLFLESWAWNGELHRPAHEGPALVIRQGNGLSFEEWWVMGKRHRDPKEGPAVIRCDEATGEVREEFWIDGDYRPSAHGPAVVVRDRAGNILWEESWDGERMQMMRPGGLAEGSAHG